MNTFDRLLGRRSEPRDDVPRPGASHHGWGSAGRPSTSGPVTDEQAIARYRYLLRTAPPEAIEQAHAEAFAHFTADQRRLVLEGLVRDLPPPERPDRDDPPSLARLATRAELRRPGTLERTFSNIAPGPGIGLGGLLAVDFLSTIAGVVVGTAIADVIFSDTGFEQGHADGSEPAAGDAEYDTGDASGPGLGGDFGDFGGGEF